MLGLMTDGGRVRRMEWDVAGFGVVITNGYGLADLFLDVGWALSIFSHTGARLSFCWR